MTSIIYRKGITLLVLIVVTVRRQVMSQEVLAKAEKGKLKPQETKNLKQLTKTIIDRFFNAPTTKVQVYLTVSRPHTY